MNKPIRIPVKPLSVNAAYRRHCSKCRTGRYVKTTKTKDYLQYIKDVRNFLNGFDIPEGELNLEIDWGVSSRGFDVDNGNKPFIDLLFKKFQMNDNLIYRLENNKIIVPKKKEFIEFQIKPL